VDRHELVESPPARQWTRVEDYVLALARSRTSRQRHRSRQRTQPEEPRAMLSTIPFAALMAALAVLAVAIAVAAWPGRERSAPALQAAAEGTAPPSWFDAAKREMR
jgi:hypothetical protein